MNKILLVNPAPLPPILLSYSRHKKFMTYDLIERPKSKKDQWPDFAGAGLALDAFVGKVNDVLIRALDQPLGYAINWGRLFSLWPVHLETGCCSVEVGAVSGPRFDSERFGILEAFGSMRQCDLLIVLGTVNRKMAPRLRMVYDQMPEPKYVVAMGACSISGGLYFDSYDVLPGVDSVVPVDVYVPGCPPRPETLIQGIMLLQEKIKRMKIMGLKR
jgi:NADH-quinone oxidoreductase subunit B